jgi:hypothetical protein
MKALIGEDIRTIDVKNDDYYTWVHIGAGDMTEYDAERLARIRELEVKYEREWSKITDEGKPLVLYVLAGHLVAANFEEFAEIYLKKAETEHPTYLRSQVFEHLKQFSNYPRLWRAIVKRFDTRYSEIAFALTTMETGDEE